LLDGIFDGLANLHQTNRLRGSGSKRLCAHSSILASIEAILPVNQLK
jgi:hypothetical protein